MCFKHILVVRLEYNKQRQMTVSTTMLLSLFALLLWAFAKGDSSYQGYQTSTCREVSLGGSSWPSDHGDSSRSKFTFGAGLPRDVEASQVKRIEQALTAPQWIYTYGDNSDIIYVLGGPALSIYVAKLDAITLEVLQKVTLKPGLYIGGLLMHKNGHVYCAHSNTLTAFWNGDLLNSSVIDIPTTLNGNVVQTNGMVVSSDGMLVIKQWSMLMDDLVFYFAAMDFIPKILVVFIVVGISAMLFQMKKITVVEVLARSIIGSTLAVSLFYGIFMLVILGVSGPFNPWKFVTTNLVFRNYGGGGQLKMIDPISLGVVADLTLPERCSYGRVALSSLENGEDAIVMIGDEFIRQIRWNPATSQLYELPAWTERYRSRNTGTFPGTGPAIFNNTAYFTDNTFPVMLTGTSYTMFRKPLELKETDTEPMQRVSLTEEGKAGFMFWSVTVSPIEGDVVVWDTGGRNVQVRRAHDLSLKWNLSAIQSDCITLAADKGHVYLSDYSDGPADWTTWLNAIGPASKALYPTVKKFLIVADTATGDVLLNITTMEGTEKDPSGAKPSLIVPGGHNDVLVGTADGLIRIYV